MKLKYKKSFLIINIILILTLLISLINFFGFKISNYLCAFFITFIPFAIMFLIFGYEKKKRRFTYETMFYTFTYVIILLIITYIIGIFIGFTQNIYHLDFKNIIHNIIPYTLVIFSCELLRYEVIRKGEGSILSYILVTILLIVIDITLFRNTYDIATYDGVIKFICIIVFPSIFKNLLLVFLVKNGGPYPSILYRLIMDLKMFIIPILPDFGMYFDSVIYTIFPVIIGALNFISLKQFKNKEVGVQKIKNTTLFKYGIIIILIIMAVGLNILTSCKFKYSMIAIGSDSMNPIFYKGDSVIYESNADIKKYKVGDILVFNKDNKIVVHRIIDIKDINDERIFYTKGDNNNSPDGYPILSKDVIGLYLTRVKYIGIISVYLKELANS